jgi:hypothetical protein
MRGEADCIAQHDLVLADLEEYRGKLAHVGEHWRRIGPRAASSCWKAKRRTTMEIVNGTRNSKYIFDAVFLLTRDIRYAEGNARIIDMRVAVAATVAVFPKITRSPGSVRT